ncbi:hypothetical protein B9Z55_007348 [Caenorhabditis nigoni]|uniref:F-box domain-containing protein n=1 Tax=Caenorhabditis nigoni TaxID=1611254 RepID=A0A2G5V991_9PELO|nr:hypothetical protein B9Z55_007348 [Caenorhabditis nigoni]
MKLFKFPYLVQEEILQNVKSSELFLLSFVSKKIKEKIKSSQLNRFKSIDYIRYECNHDGQITVYNHPRDSWGYMLRFVKHGKPHNDYFQLKVSGKMINFRHVQDDVLTLMAGDVKLNTDPITSYTYVVRETDNRVASVLIQGGTFSFGVWDKTEEEFLRMMD